MVYILTGGGPADRTQILPTLAYEFGMQRNMLGVGAAVITSALPVFLGIIFLLTRRMLREKGVVMAPHRRTCPATDRRTNRCHRRERGSARA